MASNRAPFSTPAGRPSALIAEDEPLLARELVSQLTTLWPDLNIIATTQDGEKTIEAALHHLPDMLFLDIHMPLIDGISAATSIITRWPATNRHNAPLITFVTAYDYHAVAAFETGAIDYLLKPITQNRLTTTITRLQQALQQRLTDTNALLAQLQQLMHSNLTDSNQTRTLNILNASIGNQLIMVPVTEVVMFRAADKYVQVVTRDGNEQSIRTPLGQLLTQLDTSEFWQIHRSTVVRASEIESVWRHVTGSLYLTLKGIENNLRVSRQFAWRFKPM